MKTIRMMAIAAGCLLSALPLRSEETGTPVDPASIDAYDRDRFCARGAEIRAELAEDTEGKIAVLAPAE